MLQAVVLADSFNLRFTPLTEHEPRTLLPLLNTCLLDYTLEFLTAAGVQEIVLFCCTFADKIQRHIAQSKWSRLVRPLVSQRCMSLGDALREVERAQIIRNNFVLVSGDIVSNYKLGALEGHKARLKADKDAIMTMIFKRANPGHPMRSAEDNVVVALDKATGRLLSYEDDPGKKKAGVPMFVLKDRSAVQVRYDLVDCHIALCSPQVLMLFADNFDYQNVTDFVKGVLAADELEQHKIHTHVLTNEYAARVGNLFSYRAVSKDVLHRWTYPLVPDIFAPAGAVVRYKRNHVYVEDSVILSRTCEVGPDVMIGAGTRIGRDGASATIVRNSVVGRNCVIGAGVTLVDAYVWDGVVIEDNCTVHKAILAQDVRLGAGVVVRDGSIVCHGCVVPAGTALAPGARIALEAPSDGFDGRPQAAAAGYHVWELDSADDDFPFKLWDLPQAEAEDEDEETDSEGEEDEAPRDDFTSFVDIIVDQIRERLQPGQAASGETLNNMLMEIKAAKHAHHASIPDTARALVTAIVAASDRAEGRDASTTKKLFLQLLPVLAQFVNTTETQQEALRGLEEAAGRYPSLVPVLQGVLNVLYDKDLLDEPAIVAWYNQTTSSAIKPQLRQSVGKFVEWLLTAEEESSEASDDE